MRHAARRTGAPAARELARPSRLEPRGAPRPPCRHRCLRGCHRAIRGGRGGRGLPPLLRPCGRGLPHPRRPLHPLWSDRADGPRQAGRPVGHRRFVAHPALRDPLVGAEGVLPRSAHASAVRALRHLLRRFALHRARNADAGGACGAGRRLDRGWGPECAGRLDRRTCRRARGGVPLRRAGAGGAGLGGKVTGVALAGGERIRADIVVCNGDVAALGAGLLGRAVVPAGTKSPAPNARSRQ